MRDIGELDSLDIRLATTEDSRDIIQLLKEIAQWMKDKGINQWRFLLEGGDDEEIHQAVCNQETYRVSDGDGVAATFTLLSRPSEWDRHIWGADDPPDTLYLHRLAVAPDFMGKGLGRQLLNWIENEVRDHDHIRLDCVEDNEKLNSFYRDHGFEYVGLTDGHCKYQKRVKRT